MKKKLYVDPVSEAEGKQLIRCSLRDGLNQPCVGFQITVYPNNHEQTQRIINLLKQLEK